MIIYLTIDELPCFYQRKNDIATHSQQKRDYFSPFLKKIAF